MVRRRSCTARVVTVLTKMRWIHIPKMTWVHLVQFPVQYLVPHLSLLPAPTPRTLWDPGRRLRSAGQGKNRSSWTYQNLAGPFLPLRLHLRSRPCPLLRRLRLNTLSARERLNANAVSPRPRRESPRSLLTPSATERHRLPRQRFPPPSYLLSHQPTAKVRNMAEKVRRRRQRAKRRTKRLPRVRASPLRPSTSPTRRLERAQDGLQRLSLPSGDLSLKLPPPPRRPFHQPRALWKLLHQRPRLHPWNHGRATHGVLTLSSLHRLRRLSVKLRTPFHHLQKSLPLTNLQRFPETCRSTLTRSQRLCSRKNPPARRQRTASRLNNSLGHPKIPMPTCRSQSRALLRTRGNFPPYRSLPMHSSSMTMYKTAARSMRLTVQMLSQRLVPGQRSVAGEVFLRGDLGSRQPLNELLNLLLDGVVPLPVAGLYRQRLGLHPWGLVAICLVVSTSPPTKLMRQINHPLRLVSFQVLLVPRRYHCLPLRMPLPKPRPAVKMLLLLPPRCPKNLNQNNLPNLLLLRTKHLLQLLRRLLCLQETHSPKPLKRNPTLPKMLAPPERNHQQGATMRLVMMTISQGLVGPSGRRKRKQSALLQWSRRRAEGGRKRKRKNKHIYTSSLQRPRFLVKDCHVSYAFLTYYIQAPMKLITVIASH
ncbi:hypothetical protein F5I97DRAFT_1457839 [Phlebopus sp. FC_14]|nr:hypothetical protein F5I97DRAFT_1457839 [Phlebopus sp. FC_14]